MNTRIEIPRPRTTARSWPAFLLAAFLALVGFTTILSTLWERPGDLAGLGVEGWLGIVGLPLSLAVLVPLALAAVEPRGARQRRIWRGVQVLLLVGLLLGVLGLVDGRIFDAANRNLLVFGSLLLGGAGGLLLAELWGRRAR